MKLKILNHISPLEKIAAIILTNQKTQVIDYFKFLKSY